jgi:predicted transcriptional regulator
VIVIDEEEGGRLIKDFSQLQEIRMNDHPDFLLSVSDRSMVQVDTLTQWLNGNLVKGSTVSLSLGSRSEKTVRNRFARK